MESFLYETFFDNYSLSKTPIRYKNNKKPGTCTICGKLFRDSKHINVHMRIHTGEKPYVCEICGRSFNQNSNLKRHIRYHRGEKPFHCEICNKNFACKSRPHFLEHVRSHSGEKPYACKLCDKSYSFKASLINHMKSHANQNAFVCDICHAKFSFKCWLKKHMTIHDASQEAYMCDLCKRVFSSVFSRNTHLAKSHNILTAYECRICHKRCHNYKGLKMHQKWHKGHNEGNAVISIGQKKMRTNSVLKQRNSNLSNFCTNQNEDTPNVTENKAKYNILASSNCIKKVLTQEQPKLLQSHGTVKHRFVCGICQRQFSSMTEINEHVDTHLKSEDVFAFQKENIFNVTEIESKDNIGVLTPSTDVKKVITPEQLELLLHRGPVNHRFLCGVCKKDFDSIEQINEHLSIHTNTQNCFICGLCKGNFSSGDELKNHMNIHTMRNTYL